MFLFRHKYLCFALAYLISAHSFAQLSVSTTSNATSLVNMIVGPGMTATNASLNCNGDASGIFSASGTNLGITSGIILSTGRAVDASGPNNSDGTNSSSWPGCFDQNQNGNFYDPQLSNIEPKATFDGCVLEFDIKPACSTLNINYVFGSEEYPEYVCSSYNDVFGFFISGPNPGGGSYSNLNIAQVPGTSTAVEINSINSGSAGSQADGSCVSLGYSGYYVDNSGGSTIQYDGFTTPLVAAADVVPCATYHIKLAIADAGDCIYDSGVFLAYHGLTCPQAQIPAIAGASTPVNCTNDGTASVTVTNSTGPVTYSWAPGGQTVPNISNLTAGIYTCTIGFVQPCVYHEKIYITITDFNALKVTTTSTNAYCGNPTGTAVAAATGGVQPYSAYTWNTSPVQNTATATHLIPGNYTVSVTDDNGCTVTKPVTVNNTVPTITFNDSIVDATCIEPNGDIYITNVLGGTSPYSYNWNTSPPQTSSTLSNVVPGNYSVTITDIDNCTTSQSFIIPNLTHVPLDSVLTNEHCFRHNGSASVTVLNGSPPYTFSWSQNPALNSPTATNLAAGQYIVTVTDAVGCNNTDTMNIVNINDVFDGHIYTSVPEPSANEGFDLIINNSPLWNLNYVLLPDSTTSTGNSNYQLYSDYGDYHAIFYVESINNCYDTITYDFFIRDFMTLYIPNAFSPNGDVINPEWFVYGTLVREIKIYVFDRWGVKFFESDSLDKGWDGTYKGEKVQQDVYVYKVVAKDYYDDVHTYTGTVTLIR